MGAVHLLVQRRGLVEEIDQDLELLKVHPPYHESDHLLNIAHNVLVGGERLEDIELRRRDESFPGRIGGTTPPGSGHRRRFFSALQRRADHGVAGVPQPDAAAGVAATAEGIFGGSVPRRGWDDCRDLRGMQGLALSYNGKHGVMARWW